ncbi:MAG: GNAT family N-acetyltransferase [Caldicoprobacterales bacterium]|jgi:predicted N-acetyltransferase YhbS|nr:GNAT family N-acetyltransferase [Clostridiales bacterium]
MKLEIRKATPEDIPAIHQITQEAFGKYAADLGLPQAVAALKETEADILAEMEYKTILIATLDGIPVGSIRYEIQENKVAYISRFGVKLDIQKCGVGRALMEAAEEDLRKQGAVMITLHTATKMTNQVRFYYGLGFYVHSTTTDKGYIRGLFCKELTDNMTTELFV